MLEWRGTLLRIRLSLTRPPHRYRLLAVIFWAVFGALPAAVWAQSADPPLLRVRSPFAAPIWRLAVDQTEHFVAASSSYKSATLWALPGAGTPSIIRFPQRIEQKLRAHAVALSPDGSIIAYSTPLAVDAEGKPLADSAVVYVSDTRDQSRVHTVQGLPSRAQGLSFSPDGRFLAAVLSDGCGLRIWSTSDWSRYAGDDVGYGGDQATKCCPGTVGSPCAPGANTTDLAFVGAGEFEPWLITSGTTGVRSYRKTSDGIAIMTHLKPGAFDGGFPAALAISPDRKKVAVGIDRQASGLMQSPPKVQVLRLADLTATGPLLTVPAARSDEAQTSVGKASLDRIAWLRDDAQEFIFAGGSLQCQDVAPTLLLEGLHSQADTCIARWLVGDAQPTPRFIPAGTSRLMDIHALPRHGSIAYATQRRVAIVRPDGAVADDPAWRLRAENAAADFRDGRLDFRISADGTVVSWQDYRSLTGNKIEVTFDVKRLLARAGPPSGQTELIAADQDANLIDGWRNATSPPTINGHRLSAKELAPGEIVRSAAVLLARRIAVIGSSEYVRIVDFSRELPEVSCQLPNSDEAFRVNITPDGKLVVSAHSDGTMRWSRVDLKAGGCTLTPILFAYFEQIEDQEWAWVAWRPDGKFSNDPRARLLLEWQIIDGHGGTASIPFEKMLDHYDRKAISTALDDDGALRVNSTPRVAAPSSPTLSVVSPSAFANVANERVRFRVQLNSITAMPRQFSVATGSGIRLAKVIDGAIVDAATPFELKRNTPVDIEVILPSSVRTQRGVIHICFYQGSERQACHPIQWSGAITPPPKRKLWAVLIGFSSYDEHHLDLGLAQNDALGLAQLFARDYQSRNLEHHSTIEPDYDEIHLDLVVSPIGEPATAKLAELAAKPFVVRRPASKQGIVTALKELASRDKDGALSNDLLLIYYSGHGVVHPFNKTTGRSGLVAPQARLPLTSDSTKQSILASDELLDLLDEISADKIIVLDACRTPIDMEGVEPFDPGLMQNEFDQRQLSAHFFFGASAGQFAHEDPRLTIASMRPLEGNGLFAYAFLDSLLNWDADLPGPSATTGKIDVFEVHRRVTSLFDPKNKASGLARLLGGTKEVESQTPIFVPARSFKNNVVRSLDPLK